MQNDNCTVDPAAFIEIAREALAHKSIALLKNGGMVATDAAHYGVVADTAIASLFGLKYGDQSVAPVSLVGEFLYKTETAGSDPKKLADQIGYVRVKEVDGLYRSVPIGVHRLRGEVIALITHILTKNETPLWCNPPRGPRVPYQVVGTPHPYELLKMLGELLGGERYILPTAREAMSHGAAEDLRELLEHLNMI